MQERNRFSGENMKNIETADLLIIPYCFGVALLIEFIVFNGGCYESKLSSFFFVLAFLSAYPIFGKGKTLPGLGQATFLKWLIIALSMIAFLLLNRAIRIVMTN